MRDVADVLDTDDRYLELLSLQFSARNPLYRFDYSDVSSGRGGWIQQSLTWLALWLAADWDQLAREANLRTDTLLAAARLPYPERMAAGQAFVAKLRETELEFLERIGHFGGPRRDSVLTLVLNLRRHATETLGTCWSISYVPSRQAMFYFAEKQEVAVDQLVISAALVAYEREHGKYPESLSELNPAYLPAVPLDRFSGEPFRYRPAEDGFTLYSVGHNGRDDDGSAETEEPSNAGFQIERDIVVRIRKPAA